MLLNPRGFVKSFLKFQLPHTITTHFRPSKTITRLPLYFLYFSHFPRLIIFFLLKKLVGTSIQDWIEIMSRERELPMIRVCLLKRRRKEVKVDPKLDGQWKVLSLVANGRFQVWWPMESSKLGGQWKCSKLGGQWKVKENTFSPLPIFPPTNFI